MGFASKNTLFTNNPILTSDYATALAAPKAKRISGGTRPDYCFDAAR
jgi:hypothetical protein